MNKHDDKMRQLGINISRYRKFKGLTQQQLADKIPISRGHLSQIEAPNMAFSFSFYTLFDIAEALGVEPKLFFEFDNEGEK